MDGATTRRWALALVAHTERLDLQDVGPTTNRQTRARAEDRLGHLSRDRAALDERLARDVAEGGPWGLSECILFAAAASRIGLMSEEDAWRAILSAAERVRAQYGSWTEYGEGYADEFDAVTDGRSSCRDRVGELLTQEASPWRVLPWPPTTP